jgi:hypothetical protein
MAEHSTHSAMQWWSARETVWPALLVFCVGQHLAPFVQRRQAKIRDPQTLEHLTASDPNSI